MSSGVCSPVMAVSFVVLMPDRKHNEIDYLFDERLCKCFHVVRIGVRGHAWMRKQKKVSVRLSLITKSSWPSSSTATIM
jgi:aerobic-type carbon monoxide dehydrogenase small subunit (CoxS/CutS family)